ncbi:MAG TPA: hypothetical protein VFI46_07255 [Jiangellaceae bacterium]|nr:hypothetical protein [Jiangellaceae bacterium]
MSTALAARPEKEGRPNLLGVEHDIARAKKGLRWPPAVPDRVYGADQELQRATGALVGGQARR